MWDPLRQAVLVVELAVVWIGTLVVVVVVACVELKRKRQCAAGLWGQVVWIM